MERKCTPEQQGACPLQQTKRGCFEDTHHLAYPANQYQSKIEKQWRELPERKVEVCRWLHNNLHASGYFPEKPSREEMLVDLWLREPNPEANLEKDKQLFLGNITIDRPEDAY